MTRYDGGTGYFYNGHNGIDFPLWYEPVLAAAPGAVTLATEDPCAGKYIRVYHSALGYSTLYMHLNSFTVTSGSVARGQQIAVSGNTGRHPDCISGPHLHFTARNGQTGTDNLDPYGWSGSGNDPWAPGQSYGHLFQIRIGVLTTGGELRAKDGTMGAPWQSLDSGTSALAIAEARTGTLRPNGYAYAKDGELNAGWTLINNPTSALSLDGRRIGVISSGNGYAKEGDLSAGWVYLGTGISEIAVSHNPGCPKRVGLRLGNVFVVSEGALGAGPVTVATDAQSIALGPCRIGYISTGGAAWVKEGLYGGWGYAQATNASFLSLGGAGDNNRIGVVVNGVAYAKEGPLDEGWTLLGSNVTRVRVNSGRAGVLMTSGEAKTKEGALTAPWVSHGTGIADIQLN